jgi:hypothetical protein
MSRRKVGRYRVWKGCLFRERAGQGAEVPRDILQSAFGFLCRLERKCGEREVTTSGGLLMSRWKAITEIASVRCTKRRQSLRNLWEGKDSHCYNSSCRLG